MEWVSKFGAKDTMAGHEGSKHGLPARVQHRNGRFHGVS